MKMNGTSKAVFKLLLDWWASFVAFALKNWRTNTNKLQNGYPRPYSYIPFLLFRFVERLSINIYHVLRNEFLSFEDRKVSNSEKARKHKRREAILQLIIDLQRRMQHGLPVVGRFLTDYIEHWDGRTHFLQFMELLPQLQITDYKENYKLTAI